MYKVYSFQSGYSVVNTTNGEIAYFRQNITDKDDILDYLKNLDSFNKGEPYFQYSAKDYKTMTLAFVLTNKCNLRCKYCFQNIKKDNFDFSLQTILSTIENFCLKNKDKKNIFIDLSGSGEPLLMIDDVVSIADLCTRLRKQTGVNIIPQLVCNGTLLSPKIVNLLQDKLILFGASFDGIKDYHDQNRVFPDGKPSYEMIRKNLLAIKMNDYVGTTMVISTNFNQNLLDCYLNMLECSKTVSVKFQRVFDVKKQSFQFQKELINGLTETADYIIDRAQKHDLKLLFAMLNGDDTFGTMISRVFVSNKVFSRCDAGVGRIAYSINGRPYPCVPAISVSEMVLNSNLSNPFFKESKDQNFCGDCEAKYYCGGECPIVKYYLGGNNDSLCEIKRHMFELAIKIKSSLLLTDQVSDEVFQFIINKEDRWNDSLMPYENK